MAKKIKSTPPNKKEEVIKDDEKKITKEEFEANLKKFLAPKPPPNKQ